MVRYGHKTGLTAVHQCCADGTWYVMISEDEMTNALGMTAGFVQLSLVSPFMCWSHLLVQLFVNNHFHSSIRW